MLVLSLDTTSRAGSVAIVDNDRVRCEIAGDATRTHGERLPGDLMRALEEAGARLEDVDLLAIVTGPGSFTGLRVGIAAVQGLAMATNLKVVPVSAFDALAEAVTSYQLPASSYQLPDGRRLIGTWIDAQRGEVFAALFDLGPGSERRVVHEPTSLTPLETLRAWGSAIGDRADVQFIGDGAARYESVIAEVVTQNPGVRASVLETPALAAIVGRIAARRADRAVLPHAIVPIYVRRPDAELARSRRQAG